MVKVCNEEPSKEQLEKESVEFREALDTYSKEDLEDAIILFLRQLGFKF